MRQPILIPILHEGRELYQLVEDYESCGIHVPHGLVVDGASVPRLAWWFMPPDGLHRGAALIHDWLYINRGDLKDDGIKWCRKACDEMFHSLMLMAGVSRFRAGTAYRAVRRFGWHPWRKSRGEPVILPIRHAAPASQIKKSILKPRHIYDSVF